MRIVCYIILGALGILAGLLAGLLAVALCKAAGRQSRWEEYYRQSEREEPMEGDDYDGDG